METDIYSPPKADLNDGAAAKLLVDSHNNHEFYVVSSRKFLTLFIATFGMYQIYWFYKNWTYYKQRHGDDMWPAVRAIFPIFFAHSLCNAIDASLKISGIKHKWSPSSVATTYVILKLISNVSDAISRKNTDVSFVDYLIIALVPLIALQLHDAQMAINNACGQEDGASNGKFTAANIAWIVLGVIFWCLVLIGLFAPE
ncbi:MAG: hypothetical protein K2Y28_07070 [Burkholderiaceae bacterium]|nr:hypothetical protein [Burkholderiaceae bacterium]